ncbi:Histone-lysine N-methyltransferase, H3 lysine-36 specific [Psilocybe cubensis]|uniref:Histone-lysine N-methyltransferase, H3 lysine-36 specific n=1 Tax=Psilocybe cubensis TaxID=181762 RepID=A0ACB8GNH0_PSICU|nr:Histone-lysine N-methyltransferase, H3 lysine-36 specific [Psilocybe cubensis]KAH9476999.1 Histone-lysine N-methyltransferase, H3 lysine-36 specific [Psilocybe cubensis]
MTDLYPMLKREGSQSPTSKPSLSHLNGHDLSGSLRTKNESLAATPLSSPAISAPTTMEVNVKSEHDLTHDVASPSQSPTLVADPTPQNFKASRSPSPLPSTTDAASPKSVSPPLTAPPKSGKKAPAAPIQLIGDLPIAREEAVRTFNEIFDNNYQYKTLGRSREALESMICDCTYEHDVPVPLHLRFQRKEYANIEIVLTEKKGYGLRAEEKLPKDTFIYEYVGDVVNPVSFKKRMREYAEEGIRHFYFMMLQKDEFIDATKSGGIGRFANHSCNPNCYVAKWTVGEHVRMGIFAKRDIERHEELTFNYNVDRYGHQAQECFCGEPMCVGYIGGKTQTDSDIVTMDDLYLDALGITDEQDLIELKGTKKKKGKKIDDPDFMPTLKPVTEKEVPKVVQAIRQTTSRKVLSKLLSRIKACFSMTEDQAALRQIMRLRGYSLMTNVLEDHSEDMELITLVCSPALECMKTWPLVNRNKVQDSKVHVPVEACAALENEVVKTLAQAPSIRYDLLIPAKRTPAPDLSPSNVEKKEKKKTDYVIYKKLLEPVVEPKPAPVRKRFDAPDWRLAPPEKKPRLPTAEDLALEEAIKQRQIERNKQYILELKAKNDSIKAIIASAAEEKAAAEAALVAAAAEEKAKAEAAAEKAARRKERAERKVSMTAEDKEAMKEKRLMKLVGAVVVKCMSKHSKSFDRDSFKKHAKDLTQIISEKEKKSSSYKENKLDALSDEKVVKIKKFAKEYIHKIIRKLEKQNKPHSSSTSTAHDTPSTSTHTPNSHDGDRHSFAVPVSVEEAMEMDIDSEDDEDMEVAEGARSREHSGPMTPPGPPPTWADEEDDDDSHHPLAGRRGPMTPPGRPSYLDEEGERDESLSARISSRRKAVSPPGRSASSWALDEDVSMADARYPGSITMDPRRHLPPPTTTSRS